MLYSFRRRSSTRRWILDALVVAAIGTFIGVFGYAAKLQRFFFRARVRLEVQEPGGLQRMPTLFKELSDVSCPMSDELSRADRLRSFSEVVEEVTSRDKRDKAVKKVSLLLLAVVLASDLALLLAGCQEVPHGCPP